MKTKVGHTATLCSNPDRLGFYAEILLMFGTVCHVSHVPPPPLTLHPPHVYTVDIPILICVQYSVHNTQHSRVCYWFTLSPVKVSICLSLYVLFKRPRKLFFGPRHYFLLVLSRKKAVLLVEFVFEFTIK